MVILAAFWLFVMGLLAACGDDGGDNKDTIFTGFSGVVIAIIVIWLIVKAVKKRGNGG